MGPPAPRVGDAGGGGDDRGQAFTLEGFVAAVLVLTAILLALQSVVLTPTTGGTVDAQIQQQLRTQAQDILVATAGNGADCRPEVSTCPAGESRDLSYLVRYWNGTQDYWAYAKNTRIGYGGDEPFARQNTLFGSALNATFAKQGFDYNVVVEYRNATNPNRSETLRMVYRGPPSSDAVTTTYTVTLFDNQTLTGVPKTVAGNPEPCTDKTLEELNTTQKPGPASQCYYPIPEANRFDDDANAPPDPEPAEAGDSPIYNVVEIRVIVW